MYSNMADVSYKRLMRTIDLPGRRRPTLTFRFSYDTEPDWDFVFVEAHTVGRDDWTTLPDANGHTTRHRPRPVRAARRAGSSCTRGWSGTRAPTASLHADRTTGEWNAASGRSAGWEEWGIDLRYAGRDVEVSISYASDWASRGWASSSTTSSCRRRQHVVRDRPRRLDRRRAAGGSARTPTTGCAPTPPVSRKAPRSARRTRCCSASASRGSRRRSRATRSCAARSSTCSTDAAGRGRRRLAAALHPLAHATEERRQTVRRSLCVVEDVVDRRLDELGVGREDVVPCALGAYEPAAVADCGQ